MRRRHVIWLAAALTTASLVPSAVPASAASARVAPRVAVSTAVCARNRAAGPITYVSPFDFDASAGIIDIFAAKALGYFAAECIQVNVVWKTYTATELVSTGAGQITGEGSAADDLEDVANGAHLTAIATYGDTSDYALLTAPGYPTLRSLDGHIVAYHEILPVILKEMLQRAGVKLASLRLVDDTTYNPTLLDSGVYQGLQAYQTNEPLELTADHLRYHEYTPAQFHIPGTFNVMVVNSSYLHAHTKTVADFLDAELRAFDYCAAHQDRCVQIEEAASNAAGETYEVSHALAEWRLEVALAEGHHLAGKGIGVESAAEWQPEATLLSSEHVVKKSPSLALAENTTMAASLYKGTRLIWPGP